MVGGLGGRLEELVLTIGHAAPPIVSGNPEEQRQQLAGISEVTVQPLARYAVTRQRLAELIDLL
jgi:hypothetical protein